LLAAHPSSSSSRVAEPPVDGVVDLTKHQGLSTRALQPFACLLLTLLGAGTLLLCNIRPMLLATQSLLFVSVSAFPALVAAISTVKQLLQPLGQV
jgi:hypothetical protein